MTNKICRFSLISKQIASILLFLSPFVFLNQMGVIKAVRNSLHNSEDVTALWVTHRLEELEYADGAIYMEDGKVVMHGDVASIQSFIQTKQSDYIKRTYCSWLSFLFQLMFFLLHYYNIVEYNFVSSWLHNKIVFIVYYILLHIEESSHSDYLASLLLRIQKVCQFDFGCCFPLFSRSRLFEKTIKWFACLLSRNIYK